MPGSNLLGLEDATARFIHQDDESHAGSHSERSRTALDGCIEIVAAFVRNNTIDAEDVPNLVKATHAALLATAATGIEAMPPIPASPAVPIEKSVTSDAIFCLEDGKSFRSLKRHLTETHHTTPAEYRKRWGLPPDYPMTAADYSAERSNLAKRHGLGQKSGSR